MKLIIAYVQPFKLNDVKQALYEKEIYKMSVTNAMGCGQQRGYTEQYRGADIEVNLLKKVRIEIAVNENYVQTTLDALIKGARTGNIGDGKIFVQIASYRGKFDVGWSGFKCLTVLILTGVLFLLAFAFYRRWRALWRDFEILV